MINLITIPLCVSGDHPATYIEAALRERVHLHDVVPPRPPQRRQHRAGEALPLLLQDLQRHRVLGSLCRKLPRAHIHEGEMLANSRAAMGESHFLFIYIATAGNDAYPMNY